MPRKKENDFKTKADYDIYYNNYQHDRLNCLMEKGTKDRIKLACDKEGIRSANEFIKQAIEEKLFRCGIEKQISIEDPELKKEK